MPHHNRQLVQGHGKLMYASTSSSAGGFDWSGYAGFPVYSADNQELGIFDYLSQDERTGEWKIIVSTQPDGRPVYSVPLGMVGVITPTRLLIDVTSDRLDRFRLGGGPAGV